MKKYIVSFFCFIFLLGCEKDLLDQTNPNTLTPDNFWKTEADATSGIIGAYSPMSTVFYHGRIWYIVELQRSDEIVNPGTIGGGLYLFNANPSDGNYANAFSEMWKVIFRANQVLQNVPNIEMDATYKDNILGEAYFLRAINYFVLVNHFKNVPLVTIPAGSLAETQQPPVDSSLIYDQIKADLNSAIPLLPTSWDEINKGRITKGAASALLGKTHLYLEDWEEAVSEFNKIIAGTYGNFDLMPNYGDNFLESTENNMESLFEIQFDNTGAWSAGWGSDVPSTARFSSFDRDWTTYWINPFVLDLFLKETTNSGAIDPRAFETIVWNYPDAEYFNGDLFANKFANEIANHEADPTTVRRPIRAAKYVEPFSGGPTPAFFTNGNNKRIIRLADVLLMHAEAENEANGPTVSAYTSINRVRARVDMPNIPENLSKEDFRQRVRDERVLELCNESQRPLDLQRWGMIPSRFENDPSLRNEKTNYVPGREYFPIPQIEIDTNPAYEGKQNEGYQ
ncbi:RagB/SusD family nutrient uptake outer membrane protein [Formosa sp. PL04]|uniref:RagB/SusD family nutrient uptake outer membrane protein n=1 Tax=Formosa sp. PL04 TaxID=3081755 RepID=UPI0029820B72|nr:RagB/SusD family nutrient uptake outer membrane protein [Formosa sp. PL04]MDW5290150.1 RagB/SusD family nutrient uptake outer membrane protein [Formosa sp. PL04]